MQKGLKKRKNLLYISGIKTVKDMCIYVGFINLNGSLFWASSSENFATLVMVVVTWSCGWTVLLMQ